MDIIEIELRLHPNEIYCLTSYDFKENKNIVYCNLTSYEYNNKKYQSINYIINYRINGSIGCGYCFFPKSKLLGYHEVDRERLKILYENDIPKFVYFSAHGSEGKWYTWEECEKNNGRLVVYSARASHANYPYKGMWWRIFGLANDKCSDKGEKIIPELTYRDFNFLPSNKNKGRKLLYRLFFPLFKKY
jgi:hypothetical protein